MTTFESLQAVARRPVSVNTLEAIAARVDAAAELPRAPAQRNLASVIARQKLVIENMWAQHLERHQAQQ